MLRRFECILGDGALTAFDRLKEALETQQKLSHFDPCSDRFLALHTDASSMGWSGILTSVPKDEEDLSPDKQSHRPIAFLSGSFSETQAKWSTLEQECYAIMTSMERLRAWTTATTTRIHTDNRNAAFIYKPVPAAVAARLGLSNVALNKLARWGLKLSAFGYKTVHRKGELNVFP